VPSSRDGRPYITGQSLIRLCIMCDEVIQREMLVFLNQVSSVIAREARRSPF